MSARDPRKTPAEFVSLARKEERSLEEERRLGQRPELAAPRCLRIALLRYSAGEPPAASLRWLARAVDERVRFWRWNGGEHEFYQDLDVDLDVFGAASLLGRGNELGTALKGARFKRAPSQSEVWLVRALLGAFTSASMPQGECGLDADTLEAHPTWAPLPELLSAVSTKSRAAGLAQLERFIRAWHASPREEGWVPSVVGEWSIFAAGCIKQLGGLEQLSDDARAVVPSVLIRR